MVFARQSKTTSTITGKRVRPRGPKKNENVWKDVQQYFQQVDEEILVEETPIKRVQNPTPKKHRSYMNDVTIQVPQEFSVAEILEMYPSIHQEYEEYKGLIGMSPIPLKDFARIIVSKRRKRCPLVPKALLLEDAEMEGKNPNASCT